MTRGRSVAGPLLCGAVLASTAAAAFAPPSSAAAPTPVLEQTAVLARVEGHVSYEAPGATKFTALKTTAQVELGATIDAAKGSVAITIATATPGATATGTFYGGEFVLTQDATAIATLTLNAPLAGCASGGARAAGAHARAARASARKHKAARSRSLWGSGGDNQFTTKGSYASATVIGTVWQTIDTCTSTEVGVAEGEVSVANLVTATTTDVTTGSAETVQSSGTAATVPFKPSADLAISSSPPAPRFDHDYSLTATGVADGATTVSIYENLTKPCGHTLAAEQSIAGSLFGSRSLTAAGPFSYTVAAYGRNLGRHYYCAYLGSPVAFAQVAVHVGG